MATVGGDCTGRTYSKKTRVDTFDLIPLASKVRRIFSSLEEREKKRKRKREKERSKDKGK